MLLKRIYDDNLAQASYLIGCDRARVAVVVDPNRDIEQYVQLAERERVRITHVTETHIHADFVSGAHALAERTGAQLFLSDMGGPGWRYARASEWGAELLTDGSIITVGDIRIEAVHTPGHTPEHLVFLVTDTTMGDAPAGALTGDFIFVGDVGRPDLLERAAGVEGTKEAAARELFASIQEFKRRPDYLQIWPGHGAGSACGKSLGSMPQSTLGYERLFNWALADSDQESFVERVLAGQPEPPAYFATMKHVNRDGTLGPLLETAPPGLTVSEAARLLASGAVVLDTRSTAAYSTRHAAGSLGIPFNKAFLSWAGSLLPYDRDLYLIVDGSAEGARTVARNLALIGLDRVAGFLEAGSLGDLATEGVRLQTLPHITGAALAEKRASGDVTVIDVRRPDEWEAGHIPGAMHIPLGSLARRIGEVPADVPVVVHCEGGSRSAIAASLLRRHGIADVADLSEGFGGWARAGRPVESELATLP